MSNLEQVEQLILSNTIFAYTQYLLFSTLVKSKLSI